MAYLYLKIILIFILILQVIPFLRADGCIDGLAVELGIYEDEGGINRSNYQINGNDKFVREGDYLLIDNVYANISPNCQKDLEDIYIKTKSPSQKWFVHHMGGNLRLGKNSNFIYTLQRKNAWDYEDNFGIISNEYFTGFQSLNERGIWEIGIFHSSSDDTNISDYKFYFYNEGKRIINSYDGIAQIEVLDRLSVTKLEALRQIQKESKKSSKLNLIVSLVGIIMMIVVGLATILFMEKHHKEAIESDKKREEEKQLTLLQSLYDELCAISSRKNTFGLYKKSKFEGNLEWFKASLQKGNLPAHEIWYINVGVYIGELKKEIKEKGTRNLKKQIILINQKISLLNGFLDGMKNKVYVTDDRIKKAMIEIIDETIGYVNDARKYMETEFKIK